MPGWHVPPAVTEQLHRKAHADRWAVPLDRLRRCARAQRPQGVLRPARLRVTSNAIWRRSISRISRSPAPARAGTKAPGSTSSGSIVLVLYRAADAIDPSGGSRELADSLVRRALRPRRTRGRTAVAVRVLSRPQQSGHVAARGPGPASCRPRSQRPSPGAAAGRGIARASGTADERTSRARLVTSS